MDISTYSRNFFSKYLIVVVLGFMIFFNHENTFAQSCSPFNPGLGSITGGVTLIQNGDGCANNATVPGKLNITAGNVDDASNPNNFSVVIDWNDGSGLQVVGPYPGGGITNTGPHSFSVDVDHLFPAAGANVKCSYFPKTFLRLGSTTCPSSFGTSPEFIRWNTDDQASGQLQLSETVSSLNVYPVCAGTTKTVTFTDRSTLNCVPPQFTDLVNQYEQRWRRFDYGTGGTNITGSVLINGVAEPNNFSGAVISDLPSTTAIPSPINTLSITIPSTATVGQVYEITMNYWNYCNSYSGGNAPVIMTARILIIGQPPMMTPAAPTTLCWGDPIAGQNFTVGGKIAGTTQSINWYNKNPFTNGGVAVANPNGTNSATFPLTAYKSPALGGTASGLNTSQNTPTAGAGGVYSLWVTQTYANGCESNPVEVVYIVRPRLPAITAPAALAAVCNGNSVTVNANLAAPAESIVANDFTNSAPVALSTQYVWSSASAGPQVVLTPAATPGVNSVNVAFSISPEPNTFASIPVTSFLEYTDGLCKTNPAVTVNVHVDGKASISNISAGGTICSGSNIPSLTVSGILGTITGWEVDPGTGTFAVDGSLGTGTTIAPTILTVSSTTIFRYRADVTNGSCGAGTPSPIASVTVNPIPPQPAITPDGPTTFCANSNVTLSSSNGLASAYQWYKNGTAVAGATSQTYFINTVAQSGSYTVKTIGVGPSNCPSPMSAAVPVVVEPLPSAANPTGGGAVCGGNPAPDIVWTLTGTPPFNVTYTANGTPVVGSTTTNTFTITAPTPSVSTVYQITSLQDANSCPATSFGSTATVTIGGTAPTFVTPPALTPGEACFSSGSPIQPSLNFTLDAASASQTGFTLVYTIDGGSNLTKTFNTDATSTPSAIKFTETALNTVLPSPHVVKIISIQSPASCQTIFNISLNYIVDPLPANPGVGTGNTYCSSGSPNAISVPAPGAGLTIDWYAAATGGSVLAGGSGTASFIPASAATYYAETRNTTTGCVSTARTAVILKMDTAPAVASAGPDQPNLCTGSALLAATAATAGGTGTWSPTAGLTYAPNKNTAGANVSGLLQDVPNGVAKVTTLTWTVTSALGVCAPTSDDVILTVNPLPQANNPAPSLCEDVPGGGSTAGVLLTGFNDAVTGIPGSTDRQVTYYSNAGRTTDVTAAPQTITSTSVFYTTVKVVSTNCSINGTITFSVVGAPAKVDKTYAYCEDFIGVPGIPQGKATGINLTANDAAIVSPATMATRTVEWYTDPSLGAGFLIPPGSAAGQESNYTLTASTTLYAKVINSVSATHCFNKATITMTLNHRPLDNPITGNATVCTDPTNIIIYQIDASVNSGSTYAWTVTSTPSTPPLPYKIFGGGGTTESFIIMQFPRIGTVNINVVETLNGCVGNINKEVVSVVTAPPPNTITGPLQVCTNELGVVYAVGSANPTSLYTWTVGGASVDGPASGVGLSSVTIDYGVLTGATIKVNETSSSGCAGPDATVSVVVNTQPTMTSPSTAVVCSGVAPSLTFASDILSTFTWKVTSISGTVTGAAVNDTGSGNLGTTYTGLAAFRNTSGSPAIVTFDVTPTATVAPNCLGKVQSVTLTINPEPVLVSAQNKAICSGDAVNYQILLTPLNSPAGTVFSWPAPTMSAGAAQGTSGSSVSSSLAIHITDVLTNLTGADITATYNVTPNSGPPNSCGGTTKPIVITIHPAPVVSSAAVPPVCSQSNIGLTLATATGSAAAVNYNIVSVSYPAGLHPGASNKTIPSGGAIGVANNFVATDSYSNYSTTPLFVTYNVVAVTSNGCLSAPLPINVGINPEPVLSTGLNNTVCSDAASGITLSSLNTSVAATAYDLVGISVDAGLAAGTNAIIATGKGASYIASDTYTNTTNGPLTATYSIVPVSSGNCKGSPPFPVKLTVMPEPVVAGNLNGSACSRSAIGLTLNTAAGSVSALNYDVLSVTYTGLTPSPSNANVPTLGGATGVSAGYLTNDSYTNTTNGQLSVVYKVVAHSTEPGYPCVGDPINITIKINPEPVLIDNSTSVCSRIATGLNFTTTATSVAATSYDVARSISGGLTPNVGNAPAPASGVASNYFAADVFTNTTSGILTVTYTVTPITGTCQGAPQNIVITINPEPVLANSAPEVCSEAKIGLAFATNGTSIAADKYSINGITIQTGLVAGSSNAVVSPLPVLTTSATYLSNDTYTNSAGASVLIVTYTVVPSAATCQGASRVYSVKIDPEPILAVPSVAATTICSGAATGLILNTNGSSIAAVNYSITNVIVAAGLTANAANVAKPGPGVPYNNVPANFLQNEKYTNTTSGILTVSYSVSPNSVFGCAGPVKNIVFTINPEPILTIPTLVVCSDAPTNLMLSTNQASATYNINSRTIASGSLIPAATNASVPAAGQANNYLAGDSFTNTTASFLTVLYSVTPISALGCVAGSAQSITVTINPKPVIPPTLTAVVCSDAKINLTLGTIAGGVAASNYTITLNSLPVGLTSNAGNVLASGATATGKAANYLINESFNNVTNNALKADYTVVPFGPSPTSCPGDPFDVLVTINPKSVIAIPVIEVCSEQPINLTLATTGSSAAVASYFVKTLGNPSSLPATGNATVPSAAAVSSNYLFNDKYTNITNAPKTVSYTVIPTSTSTVGGCVGDPAVITVTIDPEPIMIIPTISVCSDSPIGLNFATTATSEAIKNYNVTAIAPDAALVPHTGNAPFANGKAAGNWSADAYTNTTGGVLHVRYTVAPVGNNNCVGPSVTIDIQIKPEPVLSTIVNSSICSNSATGLTLSTPNLSSGSTYNVGAITTDAGLTAVAGNGTAGTGKSATAFAADKFTNTTTVVHFAHYPITPVNGCTGDLVTVNVPINPQPVLSTPGATVCSRSASGITLTASLSAVPALNFNIVSITVPTGLTASTGSTNATIGTSSSNAIFGDEFTNLTNAPITVTYNIIPVSALGCSGTAVNVLLKVNPEPVMLPSLAFKTICSRNDATNLTLNTTSTSAQAATYTVSLLSQDPGLTGTPTTGVLTATAGTALINDHFINVTSNPLQVKYNVIPNSAAPCSGAPFVITVTVNPEPVISPLGNTVCSRDISGISLSGDGVSVTATTYKLLSVTFAGITADPGNAAVGSTSSGANLVNLIKNDKYTNKTAGNVTVAYSISGTTGSSCLGQPQTINLIVQPEPTLIPNPTPIPVCSDVPSGIILGNAPGTPAITSYILKNIALSSSLVASGSTNAILGTYTTNNFLKTDQFTNTTSSPGTVTYTIAAVAGTCVGVDQTVVFTINPAPGVASNLNKTVCTNDITGITLATDPASVPADHYMITAVDIAPLLVQNAGSTVLPRSATTTDIQNDKFSNPTNGLLTVTYHVYAVSAAGCSGPSKSIVLTVEPTVTASPSNTKPDICSNDITNIVLNSAAVPTAGPVTFSYTATVSPVGAPISGFVPAASNLPNGTTIADNLVNNSSTPASVLYTITAVANGARGGAGCSGAPVVVTVIVEPKPKVVATPLVQTICEGVPASVVLTTTTAPTAGSIQFVVDAVAVTGGMTLTSPATPKTIYTNGQSIADVWSNPDTQQHTVTYTLHAEVSGGIGCKGDPITVTLFVNPLPNVTASAQAPICSQDFVSISLTSDVAGTINKWTAAVTAGAATGQASGTGDLIFQTLKNTGSVPATVRYTVTPAESNCPGTPINIDVIVNPIPTITGLPASQTICYGGTLTQPLTSPVAGTIFNWTVDPSSNSESVPATGSGALISQPLVNNSGAEDFLTYTINATGPAPTSCPSQPKIFTVIAAPQINASFLNPDTTYLCLANNKDFLQVQLDGQAPLTFTYSVNGVSQTPITKVGGFKSIVVTPTVETIYKIVSVQDAFGCSYTPAPQPTAVYEIGDTDASFSIVGSTAACSPFNVTLKFNLATGTEYQWSWGDGSPDSVFTYTGAATAGALIHHTYNNTSPTATLHPKIVLQTDLPKNFPGCVKSTSLPVSVYPTILTNVYPDKTVMCSGDEVRFTNQSVGVPANGHTWFYRVQGTTDQMNILTTANVQYVLTNNTATNPLIIEVVYQATNGNCPATPVVTPISVYRSGAAAFDFGGTLPLVHHYLIGGVAPITFTNTTFAPGPPDPAFQYDWSFGIDAHPQDTTGNAASYLVTYTSEGIKSVTLTVTNIAAPACNSTIEQDVTIELQPLMAGFTAIPAAACFPSDIVVTSNTSTGDIMLWKLYDNNGALVTVSSSNTPTFHITQPGTYTLDLRTSDHLTGQFMDAPPQTFVIYDKPYAAFQALPTTVFVPNTVLSVINNSLGASSYLWDFDDNDSTSVEINPHHTYTIEGHYTISLIAKNDHGGGVICTDTAKVTILAKQGGVSKIPNAFSPNLSGPTGGHSASGSNYDVFLPTILGAEEYNLQIYDRWGNLLFESNSITTGWDGYSKEGKLLPAGVYVYKITLRLSDGQRTTQIGDVTMIR